MAELISSYKDAFYLTIQQDLPHTSSNTFLNLKDVVLNNQSLLLLAKDNLKNSMETIQLLAACKLSLSKARTRHAIMLEALQHFEEERNSDHYSLTLSKLREFKKHDEDRFAYCPNSLTAHEFAPLELLNSKMGEIEGKVRSTKRWRRVLKFALNAAFVIALVVSVAFFATGAAAGCTVIKAAEQWADSEYWAGRLEPLEEEKEVVGMALQGVRVRLHEMESIRVMMDRVGVKMGAVLERVGFAMRGERFWVEKVMEEMKREVGVAEEWIERIEMKVEAFDREVKKDTAEFLKVVHI